ncbi:MAG: autotransporter-associated beta strand repeat-containing protein, partial [Gemmataceae bacterium]
MKRQSLTRFVRSFTSKPSSKPNQSVKGRRILLERLEDRLAPATYIWSGSGADNKWSTAANWVGNVAPSGSAASLDSLVFPSGAARLTNTNDLAGTPTFGSITISGSNYSLAGNKVVLGNPAVSGSGSLIANSGVANAAIELDVELANAAGNKQFVTVNSGATLSINGKISGTTGVELVKTGVGLLVLSGDNSGFTGPITLETSGGILRMAHVNALGSTTSGTTVGTNAQLQLSNLTTPVNEPLILNGPGVANSGAILSFAGNANTWAGVIRMDSNSTFGANASTTLTVSGVISDLGSGYSLVKEGTGTVVFSAANTYRGLSTVNDGTLIIENALALGAGGTSANGTVVNKTLTKVGTLAIRGPAGGGFTVVNERLLLNGEGVNNLGALRNLRGNNTWASSVILGSPAPNGFSPYIGSANGTDLTISGVVSSPNGVYGLIKVDTGRLILNNANTFTGGTSVQAGIVNIRDSKALGTQVVTVSNGAALQLEIDTGFDAFGRDLGNDSVTGVFNKLRISNSLEIQGRGVNNTGALHSISGINVYVGSITLQSFGAIGVNSDPNPSNTNLYFTNDYSLTAQFIREPLLPSRLSSELIKRGTGHLILPNANDYTNKTYIEQGWITVQNVQALGALLPGSDTVQPPAIVSPGASLHLKPPTADASFNFLKNLVLEGTGITHPFELINRKGALMSLGGNNTVGGIIGSRTSDIQLAGVAGIGVELLSPSTVSSLTISSQISDAPGRVGGITKLGSELLILQNIGTYTGANTVSEGVLRVEHDSALGTKSTGTSSTGNNTFSTTTTTVSRGISELQSLAITGLPGTFTLTFNGQTTTALATTATAQDVQDALNALSSISGVGGNVRVTRSGNIFMVTFLG